MSVPFRVFLSYRRGDTAGHVGRLYDALVRYFGAPRVFMDIDGIAPGADFVQVLDTQLQQAAVVLVVIGPRWAGDLGTGDRRIDHTDDFVRMEVAAALARPDVMVIPVLCEGATMPTEAELPGELAPLARRNAVVLSDLRWAHDVRQLIAAVEPHVPIHGGASSPPTRRWRTALLGAGALALLLALWRPWRPPVSGIPGNSIPAAVDRTMPDDVLRDARAQQEQVRDDWADDATLVYLAINCQATWTGCQFLLTFRSDAKGSGLVAFRGVNERRWKYQATSYSNTARIVQLDVIELQDAIATARKSGLVGPIDMATLEGPNAAMGRTTPRWVLEPVNREGSGRARFCIQGTSSSIEDC